MHCLLVGGIDYWQDIIVMCGRPRLASSVTEAWSRDKGRGERSEQECTGVCNGKKLKLERAFSIC